MDAASFEVPAPFSRTYRSGQTRARIAQVTLGICGFIAVLGVMHYLSGFTLIDQARSGLLTQAQAQEFDAGTVTLSWADVLFSIVAGIAFLAWLSRSVDNAPVLGAGRPMVTPRWSIGWWFVPVISFYKPYQVVRDLNTRLAPVALAAGNGVVLAWWLVWIARYPAQVIQVGMGTPTDLSSLGGWLLAGVVENGVTLVAAVLAVLVVRKVQAWADVRAATAPTTLAGESVTVLSDG